MQQSVECTPVPELLASLVNAGACRLGPAVPELSPFNENAAVPAAALPTLHRSLVRVTSSGQQAQEDNQLLESPFRSACNLPLQGINAGTSCVELSAELRITHAPAAFAMPALTRRKFHTPFKVTLTVASGAPLRFTAGVKVYSIDEAAVAALAHWAPGSAPSELSGGELVREVLLQANTTAAEPSNICGNADSVQRYHAACEYAFPALAFTSPSSVRPRWLLFAAQLPGGPLLMTQFLLPTIVMSRAADQSERAARLLWGDALPTRGFSTWTLRSFTKFVRRELQPAPDLSRELAPADIHALALKAGLTLNGSAASAGGAGESAAAFQHYLTTLKALLHLVRHQYDRDHPRIICGLGVGRGDAEKALHGRPVGTFLVRFASEGDALVLSCVVDGAQGPPAVYHVRMCLEQLSHVPLDESLALSPRAQQLLDLASGRVHALETLLQKAYLHDKPLLELARKRKLGAAAPGAAAGRSEDGTPRTPRDVAFLGSTDTASAQTGPLLGVPGAAPTLPLLCTLGVPAMHAQGAPLPLPLPLPLAPPLPLPLLSLAGGTMPQPPLFPGWCLMPGHSQPSAMRSDSGGASFGITPLSG